MNFILFLQSDVCIADFIFVSSQSSIASEIYNCEMNKFIVLQDDEVFDETLSEFSFEVGKHKLILIKGSYFVGTKIPIRYNDAEVQIETSEDSTSFTTKNGRVYYTFLTFMNVYSATGECDEQQYPIQIVILNVKTHLNFTTLLTQ